MDIGSLLREQAPRRIPNRCFVAGIANLAIACTFVACASARDSDVAEQAETTDATSQLWVKLPPGLEVRVDGLPRGMTPVEGLGLPVGTRSVELQTVCGTYWTTVDLAAGKDAVLARGSFVGLGFAKLGVEATSWKDEELRPSVWLDDWAVPKSPTGASAEVPACAVRMRVTGERVNEPTPKQDLPKLAGFVDDTTFEAGQSYVRIVVLAPGPDLVRMPAGSFLSGPPAHQLQTYRVWEEGTGVEPMTNVDRTVVAFDMDRTEVTAAQFSECFETGGCEEDPAMILATKNSYHEACNYYWDFDRPKGGITRTLARGREHHPVNCVATWEAERYCAWVGKRLPTTVEWEYAARSGKTEYTHPWGNDETTCRTHGISRRWHGPPDFVEPCPDATATVPVCSHPKGNSDYGICDLLGNVAEYVEYPIGHPRRGLSNNRGGSWRGTDVFLREAEHISSSLRRRMQWRTDGFRCVRPVGGLAK